MLSVFFISFFYVFYNACLKVFFSRFLGNILCCKKNLPPGCDMLHQWFALLAIFNKINFYMNPAMLPFIPKRAMRENVLDKSLFIVVDFACAVLLPLCRLYCGEQSMKYSRGYCLPPKT